MTDRPHSRNFPAAVRPCRRHEEIERVLVLGEDQELHCRIGEDALLGEQFLQPPDL